MLSKLPRLRALLPEHQRDEHTAAALVAASLRNSHHLYVHGSVVLRALPVVRLTDPASHPPLHTDVSRRFIVKLCRLQTNGEARSDRSECGPLMQDHSGDTQVLRRFIAGDTVIGLVTDVQCVGFRYRHRQRLGEAEGISPRDMGTSNSYRRCPSASLSIRLAGPAVLTPLSGAAAGGPPGVCDVCESPTSLCALAAELANPRLAPSAARVSLLLNMWAFCLLADRCFLNCAARAWSVLSRCARAGHARRRGSMWLQ